MQTNMQISRWNDRNFYKQIYLIDLRTEPSFTPYPDTNSCWAVLNKQGLLQKKQ